MAPEIVYQNGLPENCRESAAALYEEAFGRKFAAAIFSAKARRAVLAESASPRYCVCAVRGEELAGLAGFRAREGGFMADITFARLKNRLGFWRGLRAAAVLSLYERKPARGELLMDGIAVREDMRGLGIGGKLLDRIAEYARENNYKAVRLDVIDANPKARKLYERKGFAAVKTETYEWLRPLLGFGGATQMRLDAAKEPE